MIDRNQSQLIDVVDLLHRLHKAQAQPAVHRRKLLAIDLDPLTGVGNVAPRRREPMADHRRSDHVRDEFVFASIPGKQNRTGTAPPVGLLHRNHRRARQIDLILQHPGGPENAQQIDSLRIAQANQNLRRPLRLIARGSRHLPLLPLTIGEDLYLRAESRLVIGKASQIEANRVILVAAHIAQEHRRRIQLSHDQIRRTIVFYGNQPARRGQLHAIEAQRMAHFLKTSVAEIAKNANLRASFCLDDRRQIDPAVVVDIDRRHAPST